MTLQEIFDALSYGELSQIHMGDGPLGALSEENYPKMLGHVNLGLTALFKRFRLKENYLWLRLQPDQTTYKLTISVTQSATKSKEPVRYILDADSPYMDDLLKVEKVETLLGKELFLNDHTNPLSVHTPSTKVLEVPLAIVNHEPSLPADLRTDRLKVRYRATHPKIKVPIGYFDPERVEISLPEAYLQALLYFVASRCHAPMGISNEVQVANIWTGRYEAECLRLEQENLQIDVVPYNMRLLKNGWV